MSTTSKASARICLEIEHRIAAGAYQDGEKLSEVAIAAEFDVSRTPLREALHALEAMGLVELIPNRGAFVKRPSMTRLIEMFEVMAEIETWCVRLAVQRITAAQKIYLRHAADDCRASLERNDIQGYFEANWRFHGTIYDASGNGFLADEARRMYRRLSPFRRLQLNAAGRLQRSLSEHEAIFEAIEQGDAAGACDQMRAHIQELGDTYEQYLEVLGDTATRASAS